MLLGWDASASAWSAGRSASRFSDLRIVNADLRCLKDGACLPHTPPFMAVFQRAGLTQTYPIWMQATDVSAGCGKDMNSGMMEKA